MVGVNAASQGANECLDLFEPRLVIGVGPEAKHLGWLNDVYILIALNAVADGCSKGLHAW